jgi:hypothetical protein
MAVSRPVARSLRDHRREHLARLHGLGPRYPSGARDGIPAARRHADRAVPGVPEVCHQPVPGYELRVRGNGAWQVAANGPAAVTLASGSVTAARSYTLSLTTRGSIISARINGVLVATVTNRLYRYGPAGLGSLGYYPLRYPGFTVRPQ